MKLKSINEWSRTTTKLNESMIPSKFLQLKDKLEELAVVTEYEIEPYESMWILMTTTNLYIVFNPDNGKFTVKRTNSFDGSAKMADKVLYTGTDANEVYGLFEVEVEDEDGEYS